MPEVKAAWAERTTSSTSSAEAAVQLGESVGNVLRMGELVDLLCKDLACRGVLDGDAGLVRGVMVISGRVWDSRLSPTLALLAHGPEGVCLGHIVKSICVYTDRS